MAFIQQFHIQCDHKGGCSQHCAVFAADQSRALDAAVEQHGWTLRRDKAFDYYQQAGINTVFLVAIFCPQHYLDGLPAEGTTDVKAA